MDLDVVNSMEHRRKRRKKAKKGRKRRKSRKSKGRSRSKKYSGVKVRAHMSAGGSKFGCYAKLVRNGRGGKSMRGYCSKALA